MIPEFDHVLFCHLLKSSPYTINDSTFSLEPRVCAKINTEIKPFQIFKNLSVFRQSITWLFAISSHNEVHF